MVKTATPAGEIDSAAKFMTVIQLYAEIRRAEALVGRYEASGALMHSERARGTLRAWQSALARRIRAMVDAGERMPQHFGQMQERNVGSTADTAALTGRATARVR
jgi:hypothetical protein